MTNKLTENQRLMRWPPVGGYPSVEEQVLQSFKWYPLKPQEIAMPNKWIKLTAPDNAPIWLNVDQIVIIESALAGEDPPDAPTAITTAAGARRFVKESVDIVEQML